MFIFVTTGLPWSACIRFICHEQCWGARLYRSYGATSSWNSPSWSTSSQVSLRLPTVLLQHTVQILRLSVSAVYLLFYVRWKMANTFKCLIKFTFHLFFKLFLHMVNFPLVSEAVTQLQNQTFTCSSVIDEAFLNTWTTSGFSSLKLNLGFHILNQSICCTWNWKQ